MRKAVIAAIATAALLPLQALAAGSVEAFDLRTAEDLVDLSAVPDGAPMMEAARGFCYGFLIGAGVGALGGYIYDQDQKSKGY
jgi:glucose dehydrogenase